MKKLAVFLLASSALLAQTAPMEELIALAREGAAAPGLKEKIAKTPSARNGVTVWGQDFLFVYDNPAAVSVSIDNQPALALKQVEGSTLWMLLTKMRTGVTHSYQFSAAGKPLGARGDAIGYNPRFLRQARRPQGQGQRETEHHQQDL